MLSLMPILLAYLAGKYPVLFKKLVGILHYFDIQNRIKLAPCDEDDHVLIHFEVSQFDELYRSSGKDWYIGEGGTGAVIDDRYNRFLEFLETGKSIHASSICFEERDNQLVVGFVNGRHRYAVMRDMGISYIPMGVLKDSLPILEKHGFISNSSINQPPVYAMVS